MGNRLASPFAFGVHMDSSARRLCLNQTAYRLHELLPGQRPCADDLVLRHLRTPGEIDGVRFLRNQIDLSHSAGDPHFETVEKKETNSAWRWLSNSMASSWGPFAPSPSDTTSHWLKNCEGRQARNRVTPT